MTDRVMRAVRSDDPLMQAWNVHKETEDHINSMRWLAKQGHDELTASGALWNAFAAGFQAALAHAGNLHESVNPASDKERFDGDPGAGAMAAVLEYRDLIRKSAA